MFTQCVGVHTSNRFVFYALDTTSAPSGCWLMAFVTRLAGWQELRIGVVSKYVRSLLVGETVFTIGYHIFRESLHIVHATQSTDWILNEEILGIQDTDQLKCVFVHLIAKSCVTTKRIEVASLMVFLPML